MAGKGLKANPQFPFFRLGNFCSFNSLNTVFGMRVNMGRLQGSNVAKCRQNFIQFSK